MTPEKLQSIFPKAQKSKIELYAPFINKTAEKNQINTPLRLAHFLAQIGHESGQLRYKEEIASGKAYEGRKDLGNTEPGDGVKYKGRGLIQLTGRSNYEDFDTFMEAKGEIVQHPEVVAENPEYAVEVAGWFWNIKRLNLLADRDDLLGITYRINGGKNGLAARLTLLANTKSVLLIEKRLSVKEQQIALNTAGVEPSLEIDGILGEKTVSALKEFALNKHLDDAGLVDNYLRMYL